MKVRGLTALIATILLLTALPAAAEVRLTIVNGQVTLSASNATVREILAEWAKIGQTKIVNGERVSGGPVTLELTKVSEVDALEIILRSVSGYLLALRPIPMANASKYDRILIVPTSNAARAVSPTPAFAPPNTGAPRRPDPEPEPDEPQDEPRPSDVAPSARPRVFNTFPQPQQSAPSPPPATTTPSAPAGVPVPGMVMPEAEQEPPPVAPDSPD